MEFPGGGGSTARPSGTENPGGWGGQTGKTLRGGVWIFSGTTHWLKITFGLSKANAQFFAFSFIQLESVNLGFAGKFIDRGLNFAWFAFVDGFGHGRVVNELPQV